MIRGSYRHILGPRYRYKDWHAETVIEQDVTDAVGYIHKLIEQEYKIVPDYRRIVVAGCFDPKDFLLVRGTQIGATPLCEMKL